MRIHKQSPDIAGGVHVGKNDPDVRAGDQGILFGYAGDETGKTKVRSLMIGLDACTETAILHDLKLGEVVTTFRTSGLGVVTVECKNLSFHRVGRRRPGQCPTPVASFLPGTNGLRYVVNGKDGNQVVLCSLSPTHFTPSTASRSGKKLTDVRKNEDLWWWYADGAGGDSAVTGARSRLQRRRQCRRCRQSPGARVRWCWTW